MGRPIFILFILVTFFSLKSASQLHLSSPPDSLHHPVLLAVMPQNFYIKQLGFFCRKEIQLQKITNLPVYIRLGSKEYVDRLEGKH